MKTTCDKYAHSTSIPCIFQICPFSKPEAISTRSTSREEGAHKVRVGRGAGPDGPFGTRPRSGGYPRASPRATHVSSE